MGSFTLGKRQHFPRPRRYVDSKEQENAFKVSIGSIVLVLLSYGYIIKHGQWSYLWAVVWANPPIWVVVGALALWGAWWWWSHEEFSKAELIGFVVAAIFFAYPATAFGFWWLTDLGDTEVWNGQAMRVEKTDRYYTTSTDSKGHTTTTYHGPYYKLYTNNQGEEVDLSEAELERFVPLWGGWGRQTTKSIVGKDGPIGACIHVVSWNNDQATAIPTSVEHPYVNFVRASDGVLRTQGSMSGFEKLLKPYPRVTRGTYGSIYFDRVIIADATIDPGLAPEVDQRLDEALRQVSPQREVNVLLYIVGTSDGGFSHALEDFWRMGKNNDVVVVIGYVNNKIEWCKVQTWSDHFLFKERLAGAVRELGTLHNQGAKLSEVIVKQITAAGDEGFLRKQMSDFAYMAGDVSLPIWAYLIVIIAAVVATLPTVWWFLVN